MSVLDELRNEARNSYDWLESIVSDVAPQQASWQPPGNANTIASTYAHIVRNADEDINQHLFERPRLNEGPWRGRTGLPPGPGPVEFQPNVHIDWATLREYGRAMHAFVIETIEALTEDDLQRATRLSTPNLSDWKGIEIIRLTVGRHVWMHGGEIACLKGLQGAKGYVRGVDTDEP